MMQSVSLPNDLVDQLRRLAADEHVSVADVIHTALHDHVAVRESIARRAAREPDRVPGGNPLGTPGWGTGTGRPSLTAEEFLVPAHSFGRGSIRNSSGQRPAPPVMAGSNAEGCP